jgi:hypothetical protein
LQPPGVENIAEIQKQTPRVDTSRLALPLLSRGSLRDHAEQFQSTRRFHMHGRRIFLHAAGTALAVPVIGSVLTHPDLGRVEAACPGCGDDPVSAEALHQFKAAIRALSKSAKGEHARQAAAALRVIAANGRAHKLDAEFRRAVEREVKTYGRDNVLLRPFDRQQFAANAREFGVVPAPELRIDVSLAERRQTLDALLAAGVTAHIEGAAAFFEAAGAELDAKGPLQRVQTKEEQIQMCRDLQTFINTAEGAMVIACVIGGPLSCAYFSGVYLGAKIYYETQTECSKWLG